MTATVELAAEGNNVVVCFFAIAKAGKATSLTSSSFIKRYHLQSASSVQSAVKGLLDKDFITMHLGVYEVYDKFFAQWLLQQ